MSGPAFYRIQAARLTSKIERRREELQHWRVKLAVWALLYEFVLSVLFLIDGGEERLLKFWPGYTACLNNLQDGLGIQEADHKVPLRKPNKALRTLWHSYQRPECYLVRITESWWQSVMAEHGMQDCAQFKALSILLSSNF